MSVKKAFFRVIFGFCLCAIGCREAVAENTILFHDDFRTGMSKWKMSVDDFRDRQGLSEEALKARLSVVDAPDSERGRKAVRCVVPRVLGTFRSEVALTHEEGFQERWYGARIYVPSDWIFEDSGGDIVLQWHAVLGDEWKTRNFPPLSIAIIENRWQVNRAFGPTDEIKRDKKVLEGTVERGKWTSWVLHAKWSSGEEGLVEVWKNGELVWKASGPNTYSTRPRTPYFKTGIYHPEWKYKSADKFEKQNSTLVQRVIYTADVKIGGSRASYKDVAPKP